MVCERSSKRRKCDEAAQSSTSQAAKTNTDQATTRPPGVKASKGLSKQNTKAEGKASAEFQSMWSIKKEDFSMKERLWRMKLLESLSAK
ncbi:hypothetical protein Bca4012_089064 [Brassica carinata]